MYTNSPKVREVNSFTMQPPCLALTTLPLSPALSSSATQTTARLLAKSLLQTQRLSVQPAILFALVRLSFCRPICRMEQMQTRRPSSSLARWLARLLHDRSRRGASLHKRFLRLRYLFLACAMYLDVHNTLL